MKLIYIIVLISLCFGCAFIPNLAMNSLSNYSAARMCTSIGATIGLSILMISKFIYDDKSIKKSAIVVLIILSALATLYFCTLYYKNSLYGLNRYNNDKQYSLNIRNKIINYEKISGNKISIINYYINSDVPYCYDGPKNEGNIRFYAVDWGFGCGLSYFLENEIKVNSLTEEQQNKIDKNKYQIDDNLMYMFEKNTLYLITTK